MKRFTDCFAFGSFCFLVFGQKRKGTQGLIQIDNPNLAKPKNLKARDVDVSCIN